MTQNINNVGRLNSLLENEILRLDDRQNPVQVENGGNGDIVGVGQGNLHIGNNAGNQPVNVPQDINGQDYLEHCSNGVKGLCAKYHVRQMNIQISNRNAQWLQKLSQSSQALGLAAADEPADPLVENEMLIAQVHPDLNHAIDNVRGNENAIALKDAVLGRLNALELEEVPEENQIFNALNIILASDSLQQTIEFERMAEGIRRPEENQAEVNGDRPLTEAVKQKLRQYISDRIVDVFKMPGWKELTATELQLALEKKDYDMNSPKDLLELFNRTAVSLSRQTGDQQIQTQLDRFKAANLFLDANDDHDEQVTKLAANRRLLESVRKELTKLQEAGTIDATSVLEILNRFDTQMEAMAKQSLGKKIRDAQAAQIQLLYEQGSSTSAEITLEIGPEFSLLDDRFAIGVKFGFTYGYSASVTHPYGCITISNTIEPSISAFGRIGKEEEDVATGSVKLGFDYEYTREHYYDNPEELVEAETNTLLNRLLHYAKPLEVPKTGEGGFLNGLKSLGSTIWGGIKSLGYGIYNFFAGTPEERTARKAMKENEAFRDLLYQKGILQQFDGLKRNSVNKKFTTLISTHNVGGAGEGKANFHKVLGLSDSSLAFSIKKSTRKVFSYKGIMAMLGNSKNKLKEYLEREYGKINDDSPNKLRNEKTQYDDMQVLSPEDMLRNVAQLEGEFRQFCQETNKDDLKFHIFKSPRSEIRSRLMSSRAAGNRGEYIRALMTRCAALKLMCMNWEPQEGNGDEIKKTCQHLLDKLGQQLDEPPIVLSDNNQKWLINEDLKKTEAVKLNVALETTFKPLPLPDLGPLFGGEGEDIEVNTELDMTFPFDKTGGFYKKHNTASVNISVTGNQLLQYGPQIIGNAIKSIQQYLARKMDSEDPDEQKNAKSSFITAFSETLKDVGGNIAGDFSAETLQELVSDEIKKQTVTVKKEKLELEDLLEFSVANTNTFTVTLDFTGTGDGGVRFGGVNISNTRKHSANLKGGVPLGGVKIAGELEVNLSSTNTVLSTLGTNTFQPLCEAMYDVADSKMGRKKFALNHDKALRTLADNCFVNGSKLNNELKAYLGTVSDTCEALSDKLRNANPIAGADITKANNLVELVTDLLKSLHAMQGSEEFMNSDEVGALEEQLGTLIVELELQEGTTRNKINQIVTECLNSIAAVEPAEEYSADNVMDLGNAMKLLDLEM